MNTTRNVWQIISAIVAVISLGWGVYQFAQKEYQKEIDAATIIKLTEDLIGARKAINIHQQNFLDAQHIIDSFAPLIKLSALREDSLIRIANQYYTMAENLISQPDEKPIIIYAPDDEHLDMFRSWTIRYQQQLQP